MQRMPMLMTVESFRALEARCPGEPHGAYPKESRVVKIDGDPGDAHLVGTKGTVKGSIRHPDSKQFGYLIDWETGELGFVIGEKIMQDQG